MAQSLEPIESAHPAEGIYVTTRNLVITPISEDEFVVTSSISSSLRTTLNLNGLRFLTFFMKGATIQAACARFQKRLRIDEDAVRASVHELLRNNLLRRRDDPMPAPQSEVLEAGLGSLRGHFNMLSDNTRVMAYKTAIEASVRGKVVLDLGCGTGVLSILAARAGAKKVYAIDETAIIEMARQMAAKNGVEITFLRGNSLDLELPERVDLIVHELIGVDPLFENMVRYLEDAQRRFIKPDGVFLPHRMVVKCALAQIADWAPLISRVRIAQDFSRYGIDFSPFVDAFAADRQDPLRFLDTNQPYRLLSEPVVVADCRYSGAAATSQVGTEQLVTATEQGLCNAVVSWFCAELDARHHLSNAPWAPPTVWGTPCQDLPAAVAVVSGQRVKLRAGPLTFNGRERLRYQVEP